MKIVLNLVLSSAVLFSTALFSGTLYSIESFAFVGFRPEKCFLDTLKTEPCPTGALPDFSLGKNCVVDINGDQSDKFKSSYSDHALAYARSVRTVYQDTKVRKHHDTEKLMDWSVSCLTQASDRDKRAGKKIYPDVELELLNNYVVRGEKNDERGKKFRKLADDQRNKLLDHLRELIIDADTMKWFNALRTRLCRTHARFDADKGTSCLKSDNVDAPKVQPMVNVYRNQNHGSGSSGQNYTPPNEGSDSTPVQ